MFESPTKWLKIHNCVYAGQAYLEVQLLNARLMKVRLGFMRIFIQCQERAVCDLRFGTPAFDSVILAI